MKYILVFLFTLSSGALVAQSFGLESKRAKLQDVRLKDSSVSRKWFITSGQSLSAGFIGFRGGSASFVAAPFHLQLNRSLNNNWTAFGGVGITPVLFTHLNTPWNAPGKSMSGFPMGNASRFTVNPSAFVGLNYTNGNQSFQIEGRLIIDRNNYGYPVGVGSYFPNEMPFQPGRFRQ